MRRQAARKDAHAFLEADKEFHMALARRHSNLLFESVIENIRNHIALIGLRAIAHEGRYDGIIAEHGAIICALRDRDRKAVVQAVLDHLVTSEKYVLGRAGAA
jgi:DNA-binding GntR family transcriptional regulator